MTDDEQITTADIATPQERRETGAGEASEDAALVRDDGERSSQGGADSRLGPLLGDEDTTDFRNRWQGVQTGFVDEPRDSVQRADALVAELMQRLAATFRDERESLEAQWSRGDDVSTEDLRVALQRYRSFFERLLST
jgi:hypothetical protein